MRFLFSIVVLFPVSAFTLVNGLSLKGAPDVVRIIFTNGWVCSGTYIDPYTILTAAHCLTGSSVAELRIKEVLSADDAALDVHQVALLPAPHFTSQNWPSADIGIIKTSENKRFVGQFKLPTQAPSIRGEVELYGTGRLSATAAERTRSWGTNSFIRVGSVLFLIGATKTSPTNQGHDVSVAPNDSGGPAVNSKTKEIVGVLTTTTLKSSEKYAVPTLSTATSIFEESNRNFIQAHLGVQAP